MLLRDKVTNKNYDNARLMRPIELGQTFGASDSQCPPRVPAVTFIARGIYYYVEVNNEVSFRTARQRLGRWLETNLQINVYQMRMQRVSDVRRHSSWIDNISEIRSGRVANTYISERVARRLMMAV